MIYNAQFCGSPVVNIYYKSYRLEKLCSTYTIHPQVIKQRTHRLSHRDGLCSSIFSSNLSPYVHFSGAYASAQGPGVLHRHYPIRRDNGSLENFDVKNIYAGKSRLSPLR